MSCFCQSVNNLVNAQFLCKILCVEKLVNKTSFNEVIGIKLCFISWEVEINISNN